MKIIKKGQNSKIWVNDRDFITNEKKKNFSIFINSKELSFAGLGYEVVLQNHRSTVIQRTWKFGPLQKELLYDV